MRTGGSTASCTSPKRRRRGRCRTACSAGSASSPAPAFSAASAWTPSTRCTRSPSTSTRRTARTTTQRFRRLRQAHAARELRDRRRDDRRQGRPQQGAARASRPRSVRARRRAPRGRRGDPRRQGPPDRLHQLALAARDADHAAAKPRTRTTRSSAACRSMHPGITYIYGRQSCDTRALEGGEIDPGNAQLRRPRSDDHVRRRVRAVRATSSWTARPSSPRCWSSASPPITAAATSARPAWATC